MVSWDSFEGDNRDLIIAIKGKNSNSQHDL